MPDRFRSASIVHYSVRTAFAITLFLLMLGSPVQAGWEVQWIEPFDGTRLNLANWTPQIQANYNNEAQCYTDDDSSSNRNYSLNGGILSIIARRQNINCPGLGGSFREWTSGRINSKDKREFLYGRIEARIRFLNLEKGTWPAFWMLENRIAEDPRRFDNDFINWPNPGAGEIDVWEWYAYGSTRYITNFFNTSGCGSEQRYSYPGGESDVQQWHDYAIEWEANRISFFIDDIQVATHDVSSCAQYKEPMFVLLNVAMGGTLGSIGGPIDASLSRAEMQVDYVAHCTRTASNSATRCNESTPVASSLPVITSLAPTAVAVDVEYRYRLTATDANNDPLTLGVVSKPDWLDFDSGSGLLSGIPDAGDLGDHDVVLNVSGGGDTVEQRFTINVRNSDTAPYLLSASNVNTPIGSTFELQIVADDADGDPITMWLTSGPGWLSFEPVSGRLSGSPTDAYLGENRVTVAISDGSNTIANVITINVTAARAASAATDPVATSEDGEESGGGGGGGTPSRLLLLGAGLLLWYRRIRVSR